MLMLIMSLKIFIQNIINLNILLNWEEKNRKINKSIGLFRNKAKSVYFLSKQLIEKHNGKVPKNFENLMLPGVGRKTASVVLNEGFGLPTIAVDTHVFRVSNRTGLAMVKILMKFKKIYIK